MHCIDTSVSVRYVDFVDLADLSPRPNGVNHWSDLSSGLLHSVVQTRARRINTIYSDQPAAYGVRNRITLHSAGSRRNKVDLPMRRHINIDDTDTMMTGRPPG